MISSASVIKNNEIIPGINDKIITLSTCTSRTQDERFVVHAVLVDISDN
jgi:hypothetical protein